MDTGMTAAWFDTLISSLSSSRGQAIKRAYRIIKGAGLPATQSQAAASAPER
jgi:hypothetical protein